MRPGTRVSTGYRYLDPARACLELRVRYEVRDGAACSERDVAVGKTMLSDSALERHQRFLDERFERLARMDAQLVRRESRIFGKRGSP